MGTRKPYKKPVLESYGDIRAITKGLGIAENKQLGSPDGWILLSGGDAVPVCDI